MTSNDLATYLREVVSVLGKPWRVTAPCCTGESAALVGPAGGWVAVTSDPRPSGDRLVFETWLAEQLVAHQPQGMVRPVVTVARSRSAQEVGKDLRRRLLPKARDLFDGARDLAARRRRDAEDLYSVLDSVARRLGTATKPGSRTVSVGGFGRPLFATAQVIQPLWRSGEHVVRWSIDASPEHALALAELLGDRAFALYGDTDDKAIVS